MKIKCLITCTLLMANITFAQESKKVPQFNNNIKAIPIAYFETFDGNISSIGHGIGFERILNKKGIVAFTVLAAFGNYQIYTLKQNVDDKKYFGYKLMPGIKFYPWGQKKLTIGFGLSGIIKSDRYKYDASFYFGNSEKVNYTESQTNVGLVNNYSIQYNISKRINIGFEFAQGLNVFERYSSKANNSMVNSYDMGHEYNFYAQYNLNLSIGYRF